MGIGFHPFEDAETATSREVCEMENYGKESEQMEDVLTEVTVGIR